MARRRKDPDLPFKKALLERFYDEGCVIGETCRCKPGALWEAYRAFCASVMGGTRWTMTRAEFFTRASRRWTIRVIEGGRLYVGVGVRVAAAYSTWSVRRK